MKLNRTQQKRKDNNNRKQNEIGDKITLVHGRIFLFATFQKEAPGISDQWKPMPDV